MIARSLASACCIAGLTLSSSTTLRAQVIAPSNEPTSSPVSDQALDRARTLLAKMNLREKIGQLNLVGGSVIPGRPRIADEMITNGDVGGVLWLTDAQEIKRLQRLAVKRSRLGIPILFGLDVIHGYETMFPMPLAMASSWDPAAVEAAQAFTAKEARAAGIRWTYTPMVDIARDARWGRIKEGAGEDPLLGSAMARAQVRAFQGEALGPDSLVACVKHFAAYGAAEGGRDYDSSYVPEELLRNVYFKPFQAAVDAGVGCLMSAYMNLNDVPASGNKWLLTDVLRDDWGFKGFITSDAGAIGNLKTHGFAADASDAALKAINAGAGFDMASRTFVKELPALVASGKVTEAQIDAAVLPILAVKYQIGLFDNGARKKAAAIKTPPHSEGVRLSRTLAARSLILLKNENGTLPLVKGIKKVAVLGFLADSAFNTQGGPSAAGGFTRVEKHAPVTVLAALKSRFGAATEITYVAGPEIGRNYPATIEQAVGWPQPKRATTSEIADWLKRTTDAAAAADVVVAVLGETIFMSGEEGSRATLDLPGIQQQMLELASKSGKPVVLVLMNGRPLDIRWASEHVPAILEAWYPGADGGDAVADVLFGDVNPGGKLPLSWPRAVGQVPIYYNQNKTHHPEDAPEFTSRYWDLPSKPLYPFGFGLSYTKFSFENLLLSEKQVRSDGSVRVSVDVTNIGSVLGDTVAQIYIHQRSGSTSRPARQLAGFQRVTLKPGEKRTLTFTLGREQLSFWSAATRKWQVEPSAYDVWAGEDSTAQLKNLFSVVD